MELWIGPFQKGYFNDLKDGDVRSQFLGPAVSPYRYTQHHSKTWFTESSLGYMARKFVQLPAQEVPDRIGGTVSVIRIDGAGLNWVYKGVCRLLESRF